MNELHGFIWDKYFSLSDLKLIGTVPAVINDSVLGSCVAGSTSVGRPTVVPRCLCIHLMECNVIGCPVLCCPINHSWVKCLRLQRVSLRGSPVVLMRARRGSDGALSTARASFTSCRHATSQPEPTAVCVCDVPFPLLTSATGHFSNP